MSLSPYYYEPYTMSGAPGLPIALIILFVIFYVIMILAAIAAAAIQMVAMWKVFQKMGERGWKGLIPCYNLYVLCDRLWEKKKFWLIIGLLGGAVGLEILMMLLSLILTVIAAATHSEAALIVMLGLVILFSAAAIGLCIAVIVLEYQLMRRLAHSFGKSTGFGVGLTFLSPIFLAILAFSNAQYLGPRE